MKKAIIVGTSSGIGLEVARCLMADGWAVGLMARRTSLLEAIRSEHPSAVWVQPCDVCSTTAEQALEQLVDRMGGVDLYFHAAGIGRQNMPLDATTELATLDTNVMGFSRMVGAAFRYMAAHGGGHIAVISSIAGVKGLGPAPSYSASKAFQNVYIQALEQLAHTRALPIRFTDIRPGFVHTALIQGAHFPLQMTAPYVARQIVTALRRGHHVVVVDWRYRLLVFFWRLLPAALWRRIAIKAR